MSIKVLPDNQVFLFRAISGTILPWGYMLVEMGVSPREGQTQGKCMSLGQPPFPTGLLLPRTGSGDSWGAHGESSIPSTDWTDRGTRCPSPDSGGPT